MYSHLRIKKQKGYLKKIMTSLMVVRDKIKSLISQKNVCGTDATMERLYNVNKWEIKWRLNLGEERIFNNVSVCYVNASKCFCA